MIDFWSQVAKVAVALFIITDSLGNLPFFIGLTEGATTSERRKINNTAILTGLLLLIFFVLAGTLILELFGLTMEDLKIGGGALLFVIAVEILMRGKVVTERREDVGVVPLGCPLLVGPGAIITTLMMMRLYNAYAVALGMALCFFVIWLVLSFDEAIYKFLGRNGAMIITKIAAIIIAAISVNFIITGLRATFNI
ncbi:MAG: MarC family protein [Candidatus Margulisbacteria bacterium]|nr:MarC family protein [Candidatus Margulisiibacteriota bacterium]